MQALQAVSRKIPGSAGNFDIDLPVGNAQRITRTLVGVNDGTAVTAANFRQDVKISAGSIGASDIGFVKSQSRSSLP